MSVGVTAGSRAVTWNWHDVRDQALELTGTCKSRMHSYIFRGGQTTYMHDVVIRLEYAAGKNLARGANAGGGMGLS